LEIVSRNVLYLIIAGLAVATAVLGYRSFQEQQQPNGVEISIGKGGVSIESK
jgi:hypothetical protein